MLVISFDIQGAIVRIPRQRGHQPAYLSSPSSQDWHYFFAVKYPTETQLCLHYVLSSNLFQLRGSFTLAG